MSNFFVIENNSKVRERLVSLIEGQGFPCQGFYSVESFTLRINKQKNCQDCFVICNTALSKPVMDARGSLPLANVKFYQTDQAEVILHEMLEVLNVAHVGTNISHFDYLLIGSSTGGFPVVQSILEEISPKKTIVIINQHISAEFSDQMLRNLSEASRSRPVEIVTSSRELAAGGIYFLKGGTDYLLTSNAGTFQIILDQDSQAEYHPSLNKLLADSAKLEGCGALVILSGLGSDGSDAIRHGVAKNMEIVAQEPSTAAASGMPSSAISTGRVAKVLDPQGIVAYVRGKVA